MDILERPGTVLLFRKENTAGIYTFFQSQIQKIIEVKFKGALAEFAASYIAKMIVDYLANMFKHEYIHAELVARNGWIFAAWFSGVNLYYPTDKETIQIRKNVDVFIPNVEIDVEKLDKAIDKYYSMQYDFASLILNTITKIFALGDKASEQQIEERFRKYFDTRDKLICSELVARVYEELGYSIEKHSEFVTPDDIAMSKILKKA